MKDLILKSILTKKLKKNEIIAICKLKNTYWKYGMESQLKWFDKNVKANDIHNFIFLKEILVGYVLLRRRKYLLKKIRKNYLYFDSLIILKKYRKIMIGKKLLNFVIKIIKKSKLHSLLICKKKMFNYYNKYSWQRVINKNTELIDHKYPKNMLMMYFNQTVTITKNEIKYFVKN